MSAPGAGAAAADAAAAGARAAAAGTPKPKKSALAAECEALVLLAEPGDVFAHYNVAMNAAAISTQIKTLEQKMGLKVGEWSKERTFELSCLCTYHAHRAPDSCLHVCFFGCRTCQAPWAWRLMLLHLEPF